MGAVCAFRHGGIVSDCYAPSRLASAGGGRGCDSGVGTQPSDPVRQRADGHPSVRMGWGWHVAPPTSGWESRACLSCPRNGYARPMDPPDLVRERPPLASALPALCTNRGERRRPRGVPGAQGTACRQGLPGLPGLRTGTGGPLTTDRLITPFRCLRAQSGPRKLSPMNFRGGSRSIQRLLNARPSDFRSRGRA
jgi:hypothetical protein